MSSLYSGHRDGHCHGPAMGCVTCLALVNMPLGPRLSPALLCIRADVPCKLHFPGSLASGYAPPSWREIGGWEKRSWSILPFSSVWVPPAVAGVPPL